ncbi:FMN-binding glutamate synthase family protein [bacterium]|nr:FMN-binding glutamate synthase family protein [bacterium]
MPTQWVCMVCGYVHEGETPPDVCPVCEAEADQFEKIEPAQKKEEQPRQETAKKVSLEDYLSQWAKQDDSFEKKFKRITDLAKYGASSISPMRTQVPYPDWDLILFKGAQLHRLPINENDNVETKTLIGQTAKHPIEIAIPFYVSHMSFGALSKEAKIALARGSKLMDTLICSGEGGMLPAEREEAKCYIYELGTASFSHKEEAIQQADGVEIKIGQAAKPGLGGHLPKEKITAEIATIREIPRDEDFISPGRPFNIANQDDLINQVQHLRELTGGKPIGIKFSAGHVEKDIEFALSANPDFITIDCRGGATGAAPTYIKDNVCLPAIFALHRARRYLDKLGSKVTLCVTGGFRDSADIAKALAMGADAIALATTSLLAIGCQQYRVCQTGKCPVGITTQDPDLRARLQIEQSTQRFVNFYRATAEELNNFARINGKQNIHALDRSDIFTISNEIAHNTDIEHA